MQIINSDTNCLVAGMPVPVGTFDWPVHGTIAISVTGVTTNAQVGSSDTLVAWNGGVAVISGPSVETWFVGGVWLVVCVFGIMALGRKFARSLVRQAPEI